MKRIDGIVGNADDDPELADRIDAHDERGTLERVALDASDRKKSRLRVETDAGTDLGILVDRPELRAGDVLAVDDERAIVVAFRSREAFVIELPEPTERTLAAAIELGHRIGNQHWDVAVHDGAVYVPVEADRHIIENVVSEYLPADAETRYEEVDAELFLEDDDGGGHTLGSDHSHGEDGHSHTHEEGGHSHSHDEGEHSHNHAADHGHHHADHNHDHEGNDE